MPASGDPRHSEFEIRHAHRVARISFHLPPRGAWLLLIGLIGVDLLFAGAYLVSTLPDVRALTVEHRLAFLDLGLEANLPTTYAALKLYAGASLCLLMIFSFERGAPRPTFWYVATAVLILLAIDETAQLHEVWAAGLAPKLFGSTISNTIYSLLWHLAVLGAFYLTALTQMVGRSRPAMLLLAISAGLFVLSQSAGVWRIDALKPLFTIVMAPVIAGFSYDAALVVWSETLELMGVSVMIGALMVTISTIQRHDVRYVYHPPA